MTDQDMRLRLVVRRNGLPELRLMWHVHLDSNPTISKLLQQLNDHVPLESDHWGLEDYAVELHDSDGTDFECLHYQLVRTVLKPDDRVFIRALDRDDHRRRRISGRNQISSDGRHLIDGVPFGRPHLRTTTGRPTTYIPPLKRARLTYTQPIDGSDQTNRTEGSSPVLLLTNGEPYREKHIITSDFGDTDSDADDTNFTDVEQNIPSESDNASYSRGEEGGEEEDTDSEHENDTEDENEEDDEDLDQEVRDLTIENAILKIQDPPKTQGMSLETLDKLTVLRAAFPAAPIDLYGFHAEISREAVVAWKPGSNNSGANSEKPRASINSTSTYGAIDKPPTRKRKLEEQSPVDDSDNDEDGEVDKSLWRKYDHAGFPPGAITSGKGLAHMAAISASFDKGIVNGNSETTSTTLKAPTEEPIEKEDDEDDDDNTSSSGSSSDSSTSSEDSDDTSEEDSSDGNSSSHPSPDDSDDSDSESSDNPNEESKKLPENDVHSSSSSTDESDTSDSDSGPEEYPFQVTRRGNLTTRGKVSNGSSESSNGTSDGENTGSDSSSESEDDDEAPNNNILAVKNITAAQTMVKPRPSPGLSRTNPAPIPVPPGAGKEKTKRRNARRRAAKLAKRNMQKSHVDDTDVTATERIPTRDEDVNAIDDETALFEAKRKALLDAIASGGIEVGPSGKTALDHGFIEADRVKRKHTEEGSICSHHAENRAAIGTSNKSPSDEEEPASQKRRRIDVGVGRRLVFGALGLRNPKNKEDEDKLRDQLQTDAQLHASRQLSSRRQSSAEEAVHADDEPDPDVWKLKINYRAVECCHDNIKLGPAPFPFQQRWDPQQQTQPAFKKNKRGGQGKRTHRNQSHYYDDNHSNKKRRHHDPYDPADDTYDREYDTMNEANVALNYDDIESQGHDHNPNVTNETSQTTDLDDLPSLPKDVSALPILRPGEAQVGMVITWLKWTCSSTTSWQPQLSRVAGIVVQVDEDVAALGVCLAKRDRHLDENEKRYDYRTGQRIYDRFEAPDLHEENEADDSYADAGVDEGYRNIPWADMNDPRILQQPLDPTAELDSNSKCISSVEMDEITMVTEDQAEPTVPLASSQRKQDFIASPTSPTNLELMQTTSEGSFPAGATPKSDNLPGGASGVSSVEPYAKAASNSTPHQAGQNQPATDLAMSDTSQISSPSRQLHETTSQAMSNNSPAHNWVPASSIELGESPRPNTSSPIPATVSSQSRLEEDSENDVITGTPKATLPLPAIPSSACSIHSGRQLDYAMGIDSDALDPFDATDDIDHQNDGNEPSPSSGSLSSLSSLWCTAVTSHSTQSPSRARASSVTSKPSASKLSQDTKYEEAMRRLDEQLDKQLSVASSPTPVGSSLKVKREDSTQLPPRTLEAISPPPRRRRFTIPPGSQVVELSSDSEPTYTENYADDEIDGTYAPDPDSLPRGSGWVKKGRDAGRRKARKSVV
ncbi:hypothetical protein GQX73_g7963 [Xylaria multiplex]|uniref:DUF7357 domain-containing protein n=1 Tax=Xylaria multiplex TaxID=323545 RepID=A0A7C8N0X1_9PEZI|nr:hypothetical protein GQX73_g7963 [Xylaria multiplex]